MNISYLNKMTTGHRVLRLIAIVGLSSLFLTGCQTLGGTIIPSSEYENFSPLPVEKRIMKEVRLRWEVRDDVAAYCAQSIGMGKEQAYITPPIACAIWHVQRQECTIVTGKQTSHVALGHEVRHCFEGRFHH
jgi:hypothetical protein